MSGITSAAEATCAWAVARRFPFVSLTETGSTNHDAKAADDPADEWVIVAAHQRAGRGRGANSWADPGAGAVLLSTWVFRTPHPPGAITGPRVGLGLYRAVRAAWPDLPWGLKAPNDLFLGERKVAGLLVEVTGAGDVRRLITGLGFNVLARPPLDTAACLRDHLERAPSLEEWIVFADAWRAELRASLVEIAAPTLAPAARRELRAALNARAGRAFEVTEVSPAGDLHHAGGVVRWTEL